MEAVDLSQEIADMRLETVEALVGAAIPEKAYPEQWNVSGLHEEILRVFGLDLPIKDWAKEDGIAENEIRHRIADAANRKMAEKAANYGPDIMRMVEKSLLLQVLDQLWKDHLLTLDHLRQGIGLRAYGQRDPLNEYKREAFNLFEQMLIALRERITGLLAKIELRVDAPTEEELAPRRQQHMMESREDPAYQAQHDEDAREAGLQVSRRPRPAEPLAQPGAAAEWAGTSRNAACPCGSGKKYKHCHGKV